MSNDGVIYWFIYLSFDDDKIPSQEKNSKTLVQI